MVDWNGLAEMAPVLAAGFTGKPEILQNTMKAHQMGKKNRDDQALRSFGRELFSLGHPPDEMEIQTLASKYGIDPLQTQALVKTFIESRRQKKMMELQEGEATLNREKFDESKRQFGVEQETELAKIGAATKEKEQNRIAKQVENVAQGLKWESQQDATNEYRNDNLELKRDALQQRADQSKVSSEPKPNEIMDNTRGHYGLLISGFKDPNTGGILPGKEKQYEQLMNVYQLDQHLTASGKKPTWMTGKKVKRTGTTKDGRKIIQYTDGSTDVL
jgi:hypothetical protein